LRVLFVTTKMDDFFRVGGLAAVSAALPPALRSWGDVRIILPGYRDVVEQFLQIEVVGQCAPLADMPACSLGLTANPDFCSRGRSTESFLGGIRRAFTTFVTKDRLNSMRRSAMSRSFSWGVSAACYGALYRKTVSP
jgi:glycogen synthase